MKIIIKTIAHSKQRYDTCGDYWYDKSGTLQVRISDLGDEFMEKMIMVHELIEEALTKKRGLAEEDISKFDLEYEERRKRGEVSELSEPGYDKDSPYLFEHTFANSVEIGMCAMAGVCLDDYDKKVNEL